MCAHQALSVCLLTASSAPHCSPNHSFGSLIDPKKCSTECPWLWQVLCEGIGFSLVCVVDGIPKKRDCREALAGVLLRSFTVVGSQVAKVEQIQGIQISNIRKESLWLNDTWIFCPMGESPVGSKGTMQCTLQRFAVHTATAVCKACKICRVGSSLVDMCAKYASLKDAFSI
ncbi:unnamed protein product [Sphagnum compactum]